MEDKYVLPEKMLVNYGKKQDTFYYRTIVDGKRTKINLGHHYPTALKKVSEIESTGIANPKIFTLEYIWDEYSKSDKGLLPRPINTQKDYNYSWNKVGKVLGHLKLEDIKTYHLNQYLENRTAKVRANRELALLSILFNWAKKYRGYTGEIPFGKDKDIDYNDEKGRDKYITKWEYEKIYNEADDTLKNAMDLLLFTGQRVGDVLNFRFSDIKRNVDLSNTLMNGIPASHILGIEVADTLYVKPSKTERTNKKIELIVEGELKNVIDRITKQNKQHKIKSLYLLYNENGQKLSRYTLSDKFDRARKKAGFKPFDMQLRDLRRKNASNSSLDDANQRLGHSTTDMTRRYQNNVMSTVVRPILKLY
jgi:integrase